MNSDGRSTSQQLYIPTILVIGACEDLEDRCLQAADARGLSVKTCSVHDAPHAIPRRRPLAVVAPNGISDRMSQDLEALAREVRSVLLLVDPDVSAREIEAMFSAAIAACSARNDKPSSPGVLGLGRRAASGRYSITDSVVEEAPFSRPGGLRSSSAPPSVRTPFVAQGPSSVRSPSPPSVRAPVAQQGPSSVRAPVAQQGPSSVRAPVAQQGPSSVRVPFVEQGPSSVRGEMTARQTLPRVSVPAGQGGESAPAPRAPGIVSTRPAPLSPPRPATGISRPTPVSVSGPAALAMSRPTPVSMSRPTPVSMSRPTAVSSAPVRTATLPSMEAVASRATPVPGPVSTAPPSADSDPPRSVSGIPERLTEPPTSGTQSIERPSFAAIRSVFGAR
ncbi:MAG: hypothetical protein U0441_10545 [Polyangiaceae bacterium]